MQVLNEKLKMVISSDKVFYLLKLAFEKNILSHIPKVNLACSLSLGRNNFLEDEAFEKFVVDLPLVRLELLGSDVSIVDYNTNRQCV